MAMKVDGDWGCGENCGVGNTRKWGPNSIYEIKCGNCGQMIEFFKDEKKHTCHKCGEVIHNEMVGTDCC